jgi:4-hydroxy-tetrahydrodipicolinate reductase
VVIVSFAVAVPTFRIARVSTGFGGVVMPRPRGQVVAWAADCRVSSQSNRYTVLFAGIGERLTIGHEATDRSIFALGALRAAKWIAAQKPGRYTMANVLGLKTIG